MLEIADKKFEKYRKRVEHAAKACLLFLRRSAEADIYLISKREMRNINKKFRGKDKETNVLSFREPEGFPHPEKKKKLLGEVYLAPEHIEKKGENIETLVIHGILHCMGYTHDKVRDRMEMEKVENKIFQKLKAQEPKHK